tara:strand:+ start:126 stop:338 length:213 start_codon:yes stop_codon:yes gene_type:complete
MTIEMIQSILMMILLVMFIYSIKLNEKRIKQIKANFYLEGYKDGCKATADKTTEMIREINENYVNKNEVL